MEQQEKFRPDREESVLKWYKAAILISCAFVMLYFPLQIGDRELYWRESDYAAVANEINFMMPITTAHGKIISDTYPLFPWLAAYCNQVLGMDTVIALRLISILSLAGLAVIVWETGRRAAGIQAATVAAAVMISSNIVIEKTLDGYPNMTALLFLSAAWFTWFTYGAVRGSWNIAWAVSSFFCGLAFYTIGWSSIIYFFFPLIFMRRPLTVWQKLRKPGFLAGLGIILFFVLIWGIPRWRTGSDIPFAGYPFYSENLSEYIAHIFLFPVDTLMRLLPWAIIIWPPFCPAYFPLDKNPIFSRYLRTIVISIFALICLSPYTKTRDILILCPPLAILIGINYQLFARRHRFQYAKFLKFLSIAPILAGAGIIAFYLVPVSWWEDIINPNRGIDFRENSKYIIMGTVHGSLLILTGIFLMVKAKYGIRLWAHILLLTTCGMLVFWSIGHPYKSQENSKSSLGIYLRNALGKSYSPSMTVYKDSVIDGLYGECYYLGCNIREMRSYSELPPEKDEVFLLSTDVPIFTERLWTNLLPRHMQHKDKKIYLWKGEKVDKAKSSKNKENQDAETIPLLI
ncbi:MAG: hypothetical protein A2020_04355 [Lentisphaerae bacterium GWF2_45_14]|nr:MAG: hypothetical protein A2020_04355 [Lentisphaerae bacterium GWF2_45_14]